MSAELLEAALAYAKRSWPVFPLHAPTAAGCTCGNADCASPGKHPRTAHGLHDATTDPDVIRKWWTRWPKASIGLRTGIRFDVLDLDNVDDALDRIDRAAPDGPAVKGPTVHTGNGLHIYVAPTGEGNRTAMLPGVDWRGRGGYVVAPPSLHANGLTYAWSAMFPTDTPITAAPPWLLHLVRRDGTSSKARTVASTQGGTAYGRKALESELGRCAIAPEGARNDAVNLAALKLGHLVAGGELSAEQVAESLLTVALRIGLSETEAVATIHSGMDAGMRNPKRVTR